MNHHTNFAGQRFDSRARNDNSSARYSAPSDNFKEILAGYANPYCVRCRGTGYIGVFKHVCAGRCFKCIRETVWESVQAEFDQACEIKTGCDEMADIYLAICGEDNRPAYLCDGLWLTAGGQIYDTTDSWELSSKGRCAALRPARWTA